MSSELLQDLQSLEISSVEMSRMSNPSIVRTQLARLTLSQPRGHTVSLFRCKIGHQWLMTIGVSGELIRSDVLSGEKGAITHVDINVIDTTGCKPVTDAYVEIWGSNSTVRTIFCGLNRHKVN